MGNEKSAIAVYDKNTALQVFNSFFEDDEKNIIFYYCGKDSVLGISHPDYIMKNEGKHNYARIAYYKFNEIGDDQILVYMNETYDVMLIPSTTHNADYSKMHNFKIHFEAVGEGGCVKRDSIRCTIKNCTLYSDEDKVIPYVVVTEDPYQDDQNQTKYGVGIWIEITDIAYVMTNVDKSISANSVPIDTEHFPSSYTVEHLTNSTKSPDVNLINVWVRPALKYAVDSERYINDRLEELERKTEYDPHQFVQNTVVYNPNHNPTQPGFEEVISPATVRGSVLDRIVGLDPVNKTFHVLNEGIYMIQLKNGFYLVQGESRLDLNVYVNSDQIKEMRICSYLQSNPEGMDDDGKVIKNIYSSNAYIVKLDPDDEIKLTGNFMNLDNIVLENETMITITALQYNIPSVEQPV